MEKQSVSISTYYNLQKLFELKGWNIDETFTLSVFNRYYRTLESLPESEQNFLLKLSHNFLHINQDHYNENLDRIVQRMVDDNPHKTIYFTCCLSKENIEKRELKSAHSVLYLLKGTTIKYSVDFKECTYKVVSDLSTLSDVNWDATNMLVLVDDFIGTGKTAETAISYVKEVLPNIKNENLAMLSIVSQKIGIQKMADLGIKTYTEHIVGKGISDMYTGAERDAAKAYMEDIESRLKKLSNKFKFGYEQSEALVCMQRCPNNTFPIYWLTPKSAPYER